VTVDPLLSVDLGDRRRRGETEAETYNECRAQSGWPRQVENEVRTGRDRARVGTSPGEAKASPRGRSMDSEQHGWG